MKAKALKHKTLKGVFGVIHYEEIWESDLPKLFPDTCTMEGLKEQSVLLHPEQFDDYDLVTVEITIVEN